MTDNTKHVSLHYVLNWDWEKAHKQLGKHIGLVKNISQEYENTVICKGNTQSGEDFSRVIRIAFYSNSSDDKNNSLNLEKSEADLEAAITKYINKAKCPYTIPTYSNYKLASKVLEKFNKKLTRVRKRQGIFLVPKISFDEWYVIDMK